jgi:hypothetical protein
MVAGADQCGLEEQVRQSAQLVQRRRQLLIAPLCLLLDLGFGLPLHPGQGILRSGLLRHCTGADIAADDAAVDALRTRVVAASSSACLPAHCAALQCPCLRLPFARRLMDLAGPACPRHCTREDTVGGVRNPDDSRLPKAAGRASRCWRACSRRIRSDSARHRAGPPAPACGAAHAGSPKGREEPVLRSPIYGFVAAA